jgi:adenylate kinase family enzyme
VILGPGAAGRSTLAKGLAEITGIPVVELDRLFWRSGRSFLSKDRWTQVQAQFVQQDTWIMDGDLGPYDVVEPRLRAADTVIVLDFSPWRCVWRSLGRSHERLTFWLWMLSWRRQAWLTIRRTIAGLGPEVEVHVLRTPSECEDLLTTVKDGTSGDDG